MKRHLFYTFLGIFLATSIVTLLGVIGAINIASGYLTSLVAAFLIELAGAVIAIFQRADFFSTDEATPKDGKWNKIQRTDTKVVTFEGIGILERFRKAQKVRLLSLAGTQSAQLGLLATQDALFAMSAKNSLEILLGDPTSAGVKLRYSENGGEPPTREMGLRGLDQRLLQLYERWKSMPTLDRNKVDIRVFECYPTLSLVQVDDDYFFAAYGFQLRGGDCPRIHIKRGDPFSTFLDDHFTKVRSAAPSLTEWVKKHHPKEV